MNKLSHQYRILNIRLHDTILIVIWEPVPGRNGYYIGLLSRDMYYIFKPKINLKLETDVVGDFNLTMELNNVILETNKELTDAQILVAKNKIRGLLRTKFSMANIELEIINVIN